MDKNYYNNTASTIKTSFLAGVELIKDARIKFNVHSENWTYPRCTFGESDDPYYAEIWTDGMDWNLVFWLLETTGYGDPKVVPCIIFDEKCLEDITRHSINNIVRMIFKLRRDKLWIKQYDIIPFGDDVLPFLKIEEDYPHNFYNDVTYEHGSQPKVKFQLSKEICNTLTQYKNKKYES